MAQFSQWCTLLIIQFFNLRLFQGWDTKVKMKMCGTLEYMSPEVSMSVYMKEYASDLSRILVTDLS